MANKSVEILIEADNQASKELKVVKQQIEQQVSGIQKAGQKAKASTELVGTFAAAFGGSEIAGFAGEIAQMSDRVREFGEVGKMGKLSALAFKGALVAGVAVVAVKVGKAIGDLVFQTEKWNRKIEESAELSDKLASKINELNREAFATTNAEIEIIRDPATKETEIQSLFDVTARNVAGTEARVKRLRKETEEWADAWQITGERKAMAKMAEQELKQAEDLLEIQTQQREELRKRLSPIQKEFEERKKIFELQQASDGYLETLRDEVELLRASKEETYAILAARNTQGTEANAEAERLLRERDAILAKKEAEKELARETEDAEKRKADAAKKAADERIAAAKKLAASERAAIQNLQQQIVTLVKGEQAGRQFALEAQGIDSDMAAKIAEAETKLARIEELKNKATATDPGQVQGVQSRLLSRGGSSNLFQQAKKDDTRQLNKEQRDLAKDSRDLLSELLDAFNENRSKERDRLKVTVVS